MMQIHYKISLKTLFWIQHIQNFTKSPDLVMSGLAKSWFGHVRTWKVVIWTCPDLPSRDLDMSGPVQEDKYLLQNSGNIFFEIFGQILRFLIKIICFLVSPAKTIQNHLEISSRNKLWTKNMRNSTKSRKSDMSGPSKTCPRGQVLTANQRKYFYFFQKLHLSIVISKFIISY